MNDFQDLVAADVADRQERAPEGLSVLIMSVETDDLAEYGLYVARHLYPDVRFTGRVLHIGIEHLGPNRHEVVLEIG